MNEAVTTTPATPETAPVDNMPITTPDVVGDKQKAAASELETLPQQVDWSNLFFGVILVGIFVAIFLGLGGARYVRRLVKGDEVKYGKLRETDP